MVKFDIYSIKVSLELVASIEFKTRSLNPNIFAVYFLSIGILVPPIAHAPSGELFKESK